uniref:Uncharacterized protein n=1 Tax=Aegilops tauschii subsp. strangulata TaxID=200361 RepID=A0A453PY89_AEGTS
LHGCTAQATVLTTNSRGKILPLLLLISTIQFLLTHKKIATVKQKEKPPQASLHHAGSGIGVAGVELHRRSIRVATTAGGGCRHVRSVERVGRCLAMEGRVGGCLAMERRHAHHH